MYSCLLLYRSARSLCLYSCILKKASNICFCNDHLANKQLMVFLHRCSYSLKKTKKTRRPGPGACPSGDPVNLQLPLLLFTFPSFKPDLHFLPFLSFFHPLSLPLPPPLWPVHESIASPGFQSTGICFFYACGKIAAHVS